MLGHLLCFVKIAHWTCVQEVMYTPNPFIRSYLMHGLSNLVVLIKKLVSSNTIVRLFSH